MAVSSVLQENMMIQRITRFFSASIPLPQLQITKHSSFGTAGKGKKQTCLGLLDAFALEQEQGNHTPSPGASTARRTGSEVRFSGVVSANPLYGRWCRLVYIRSTIPILRIGKKVCSKDYLYFVR
jgi:hypothetical protein